MKPQWIEYTGSNEQIAEIENTAYGFMLKLANGRQPRLSKEFKEPLSVFNSAVLEFLICNPHQYADIICRQAMTGQPVWVKEGKDHMHQFIYETNTPDWNIPGAEYSFTPFED